MLYVIYYLTIGIHKKTGVSSPHTLNLKQSKMKLEHLQKTLTTCIQYHTQRGNDTKVKQLQANIEKVANKRLEDVKDFNGLYLG